VLDTPLIDVAAPWLRYALENEMFQETHVQFAQGRTRAHAVVRRFCVDGAARDDERATPPVGNAALSIRPPPRPAVPAALSHPNQL
jgi:hypothetical protein